MTAQIKWGMIGCGDVTEVKSGPAFQKVPDSSLVAVMSRNAHRAEDYAHRHGVPRWYDDASKLIQDPEVNAVYIATPPSSHEQYALEAIRAGKPVYVEKPMCLDQAEAARMASASAASGIKMVVAHYRREQPLFQMIRSLLDEKAIGEVRMARLQYVRPLMTAAEMAVPKTAWRVDPAQAGGGLFHDLAPHQLDLMTFFFGEVASASGTGLNQGGMYKADDIVTGMIRFKNDVLFTGNWCFNAAPGVSEDSCIITGSTGSIQFSVFGKPEIFVTRNGKEKKYSFPPLQHVQMPMIARTVEYFLGRATNPCSPEEGAAVMSLLDSFTHK